MWALLQSYKLSSKLHLVSPSWIFLPLSSLNPPSPFPCNSLFSDLSSVSLCFPLVFSFSPSPPPISLCVFQPFLCWPSSFFYCLTLVALSSLPFSHFTCISTSTRIPRNPYTFRGFSWNLFQTSDSVGSRFPKGVDSARLPTLIQLPLTDFPLVY